MPRRILNHLAVIVFLNAILSHIAFADDNNWSTNGPEGATVITIAIAPDNSNNIYVGTISDEIYRSSDGGLSWNHYGTGIARSSMRDICFHPLAPDTMYSAAIYGMYKSSDGGLTWNLLIPPLHELNEYRDITVHPTYPNIIFGGGPFDAWRSTDSGESWTPMQLPGEYGYEDMVVNHQNSQIVYLTTESVIYGKAVFKSTDSGQTWVNIHNNLDSAGVCRDICLDPFNSDIIYLARWDFNKVGAGRFLSKSTDGGQRWIDISPQGLIEWGIMDVEASPVNRDEIFACGVMDGVFKSTDGGLSWEQKNRGLHTLELATIAFDSLSGIIFLGTFYDGIYRSTDGGESWNKISYDIHLSACNSMAFNLAAPNQIAVSAQNGLFLSGDGGSTWRQAETGIGILESPSDIVIDMLQSDIYYMSTFNRSPWAPITGFYYSPDAGNNWIRADSGLPDESSFGFIAISYGQNPTSRYFLGGYRGIFYSDDLNSGWQEIINGLPAQNYYSCITICDFNQEYLALGDYQNKVYISSDRGVSWAQTAEINAPWPSHIADIVFFPDNEQSIYISSFPYALLKSNDGGGSWSDISGNLPRTPDYFNYLLICGIVINPFNHNNIFASIVDHGVFQSLDGGSAWDSLNTGFNGDYPSGNLYFPGNDTTLLYLTSSRSVWSIHRTVVDAVDEDTQLPDKISLSAYPNPFNSQTTIRFSLSHDGPVAIEVYDILGRKVATLSQGVMLAGPHALVWDATGYTSGVYFLALKTGESTEFRRLLLLK